MNNYSAKKNSSWKSVNTSKEQLALRSSRCDFLLGTMVLLSKWVLIWLCIFLCWCYWTYQKGMQFFILPSFWGYMTAFSLSCSQVGQSVTLDIWKSGPSKSGSRSCMSGAAASSLWIDGWWLACTTKSEGNCWPLESRGALHGRLCRSNSCVELVTAYAEAVGKTTNFDCKWKHQKSYLLH